MSVMSRALPLALLMASCWQGAASTPASSVPEAPPPSLKAKGTFRTLWWSTDQMEGLDVDSPPEKATEVTLERWEYSDPVGVPHPDTVDVLVRLDGGQKGLQVDVEASYRFAVGPIDERAETRRDVPQALPGQRVSFADASARFRLRNIDIKSTMDRLFERDQWPWRLEVTVVFKSISGTELGRSVFELPIYPAA